MKIGITGCTGRVGQLLIQELQSGAWAERGLELSFGLSRKEIAGASYPVTTSAAELFAASDAVIDFTLPEATPEFASLAAKHGTALIVGTTGLTEAQEQALKAAAEKTTIVYAANMSLGVNLLLALVEQAASKLGPDWDIEIFEAHHKHKIDAPSGTALALGTAAQEGRSSGDFVHERAGARKSGDIGYAVSRGGDVVGEHTVTFYTNGERIELGHRATNRALFARGALTAAKWCENQSPGLYSMKDVLGI